MVRPTAASKRKLFSNTKDQFKENEPDHLNSRSRSDSFFPSHSITNGICHLSSSVYKRSYTETSLVEGSDRERDDGGTHLSANTPIRAVMPMSERQQIALLKQMASPSTNNKADFSSSVESPQASVNTPTHIPSAPLVSRSALTKRNERGETPLHVAAIKGDADKVSQLIAKGANVNATDYAGWTALHEACNRGFLLIASLLIGGGADVNAKGLDNDTPLHDACMNNHVQIVKLLLQSNAKTDVSNSRGKTPFHVCRSPRVLHLLEEAKAGDLLHFPEKEFRALLQDSDISLSEKDFPNTNFTFPSLPSTPPDMSRKTPPNSSKPTEEKFNPGLTSSNLNLSPASTVASSTPGNGANSSTGSNSRPVSPRVTLRLSHVQRTPDKIQQRMHEPKDTEDVYEFRCSKDETKESGVEGDDKINLNSSTEGAAAKSSLLAEGLSGASNVDCGASKSDKRTREGDDEEEDLKKAKRRKEEGKEGPSKVMVRGAPGGRAASEKSLKASQRLSGPNGAKQASTIASAVAPAAISVATSIPSTPVSSSTTSTMPQDYSRKSPPSTVASKGVSSSTPVGAEKASLPAAAAATAGSSGDSDDGTGECPKVPPLKIVLSAPCSTSEQEPHAAAGGKTAPGRHHLPYVVNAANDEGGAKEGTPSPTSTETKEASKEQKEGVKDAPTTTHREDVSSSTMVSVSSPPSDSQAATSQVTSSASSPVNSNTTIASVSSTSTAATVTSGSLNLSSLLASGSTLTISGEKSAPRITRSRGGANPSEDLPPVKTEAIKSDDSLCPLLVVHPRKRKIKIKESEPEVPPPAQTTDQTQQPTPVTNCYEMFFKIRKQVERRRKLLFPVQPKPPQHFKNYLMNRCSYVLANSPNAELSVPRLTTPTTLSSPLKDLFGEQEQLRHKLRLQQLIEKQKLVLSVEQEILRVHGRWARALANQILPFSVCTILKDEEVYNIISAEQQEKDRNPRSRYSGRLFISWLEEVDEKWEKIKGELMLRHHNEAESLHAVQKMDWEWKMKELCMVEANVTVQVEEKHVPIVHVADFDFSGL